MMKLSVRTFMWDNRLPKQCSMCCQSSRLHLLLGKIIGKEWHISIAYEESSEW